MDLNRVQRMHDIGYGKYKSKTDWQSNIFRWSASKNQKNRYNIIIGQ